VFYNSLDALSKYNAYGRIKLSLCVLHLDEGRMKYKRHKNALDADELVRFGIGSLVSGSLH
jgi:hypothetical protein